MAIDVGMTGKVDDLEHLPYAAVREAIIFTRDKPFAGRAAKRSDHAGLICWTGEQQDIGGMIRALARFADSYSTDDIKGRVFWLK